MFNLIINKFDLLLSLNLIFIPKKMNKWKILNEFKFIYIFLLINIKNKILIHYLFFYSLNEYNKLKVFIDRK